MATIVTKKVLIQAQTVFDVTGLNQEIDEKLINPFILTAQELHIEPLLGTRLYDAILNDQYNDLKENFVYQPLCWYTVLEALPLLFNRIGNGGVFNNAPENAQIVQNNSVSQMKEWASSKANEYANRLFKEVSYNSGSYPEFRTSQPDEEQSSDSQIKFGLLL